LTYKPFRGQRFFRDGTAEDAIKIIERRIAGCVGTQYEVPLDVATQLRRMAREQTDEFRPGWPFLDRAPDRGG
jgi:hypothetical protein